MSENRQTLMLLLWLSLFLVILFVSFIIAIILLYQNKQIKHQQQILEIKATFETMLLSSQIEIQEQTFQNISREIHDNIGLSLTLSKLNLTLFCEEHSNQILTSKISGSIELISSAIEDLRNISRSLNSDSISSNGFLRALEGEVEAINKLGIALVKLSTEGTERFFHSNTELVVFRIVQEALNNAIKHSKAKIIEILTNFDESHVEIRIEDDGKGFNINDIHQNKGSGLRNMSARTKSINGQFNILSNCQGTKISIIIPI